MTYTVLQLVLMDETGDSYYRMRWPAAELAEQDTALRVINLDAAAKERFEWARTADLLVLYQSADLDMLPVIEERKKAGLKTLVEYNDNFYESPAWGPVAHAWRSPLIWQSYELIMKAVDGVIVTGQGLFDLFSTIVPASKITILKNHLHTRPVPIQKMRSSPTDPLIIGWAGSLGHMADLLALAPFFQQLIKDHPTITLHVMGNESIPSLLHLPENRMKYTPWGSIFNYYEFWKPVHLGIVPLLDTAYNRCRSDIKAVEIAAANALPLLPNALPYQNFLTDCALTPYTDTKQLTAQIERYLTHPGLLAAHALQSFQYVAEKRFGPARLERLQFLKSLLAPEPVKFYWPMTAGYFELKGSAQEAPSTTQILENAQSLVNQKKSADAYALLQQAVNTNRQQPELWLALLRFERALRLPALAGHLSECKAMFQRDLRFPLLEISSLTKVEERQHSWNLLLQTLRESDTTAIRFFEQEIISRALADSTFSVDMLNTLNTIYPDNAALRLRLAEQLEAAGETQTALQHYTWLKEEQLKFQQNREFLAQAQEGYLNAWCETLQARVKNS